MTLMTGDKDGWARREDVRQMGRDILDHMDQRFREKRELDADKHSENLDRFDTLITKSDRLNERVTTLEAITRTLQEEFKAVRERWHAFRDSISAKLGDGIGTGENRKIVMRDFLLVSGTITACYAFAKAFKWIP